ncbi:MAG: hypothetical protein EAX90_13245 [Candidatus Heimdallarchaeota archaeon]|nr:hypothetical protein [Candidatus Heimdallarchaeota archaeon]
MSKGMFHFQPDKKLLIKYQIGALLISLTTIILTLAVLIPLYFFGDDAEVALIALIVICSISVAGLLLAFILFPFYYRSIKYELTDKEMIVKRGFIQKIVKVVPLRAVTNLAIIRGPLERIIGIGRIEIHTAGYSTNQGPEEKIEGLVNYNDIYEALMAKIKKYRDMTPLASIEEDSSEPDEIISEILRELKEIKEILKNK